MVRIVRRREPGEVEQWRTVLQRQRAPDYLVDALDRHTARYLLRLHDVGRNGEIHGSGFRNGELTVLQPPWFGEGRSRIEFIRQQMILADGTEVLGLLFGLAGAEAVLPPVKALARLVGAADWRFFGMLAHTAVDRLGIAAIDTATGEPGEACAAWWLSVWTEKHAATRLKAQRALAEPGTPWVAAPAARDAEEEREMAAAPANPTAPPIGSSSPAAPPQRPQRPAPNAIVSLLP